MRFKNKLKRIKLQRAITNLKVSDLHNQLLKKIFVGYKLRIVFYGYGWHQHIFYGICKKTYKTKNLHSIIKLYNTRQKIEIYFNLNQNIFQAIRVLN